MKIKKLSRTETVEVEIEHDDNLLITFEKMGVTDTLNFFRPMMADSEENVLEKITESLGYVADVVVKQIKDVSWLVDDEQVAIGYMGKTSWSDLEQSEKKSLVVEFSSEILLPVVFELMKGASPKVSKKFDRRRLKKHV